MNDRPGLAGPRRAVAFLAVAVLLLPQAAAAQSKKPAAGPAAAPAPRPAVAPRPSPLLGRWELDLGAGLAAPLESGIDVGPRASAAGLYGLVGLTPAVVLQLGGSLGWSWNGGRQSSSLHTFELLPLARLRGQVAPSWLLLGEFGVGLAVLRSSARVEQGAGQPLVTETTTDTSAVIRLGAGVGYDLGRQWSLTLSPAFCIYARSSSVTQFTLLAGALYRL